MAKSFKYFDVIDKSGLRKVIINNPKKKNAINLTAYQEMTGKRSFGRQCHFSPRIEFNNLVVTISDILKAAATDPTINLIVITGVGDFFSAGNDLSAMLTQDNMQEAIQRSRVILHSFVSAFITVDNLCGEWSMYRHRSDRRCTL